MRKGTGNFVEADEIRLMQFVSLALEDAGAGLDLSRQYSMGSKDVTVSVKISVKDNDYTREQEKQKRKGIVDEIREQMKKDGISEQKINEVFARLGEN